MVVPIAVLVIGIAVVAYGALRDRTRRQQAQALLNAPPDREIPGFTPTGSPTYLLGTQAHQRPTPLPALLEEPAARRDGTQIPYGFASPEFATHTGPIAVLDEPHVLVCDDQVTSTVEVLHALARYATDGRSAVLVAPEVAEEVRATLQVNAVQGKLAVLVVLIDDEAARGRVATALGATAIDGFDLHSGYVPAERLGRAAQWVSDARHSWILQTTEPAETTAD